MRNTTFVNYVGVMRPVGPPLRPQEITGKKLVDERVIKQNDANERRQKIQDALMRCSGFRPRLSPHSPTKIVFF